MGSHHAAGGDEGAGSRRADPHAGGRCGSARLRSPWRGRGATRVTATAGLVSVIGGPLPTGRRRAIEQVIRTSAPMHEGFSGGALVGADGGLLGVTTAASIRGLGVVIPAAIAWAAAADILQRGTLKRGYLGIAAQPVSVPEKQRAAAGAETGPARRRRQGRDARRTRRAAGRGRAARARRPCARRRPRSCSICWSAIVSGRRDRIASAARRRPAETSVTIAERTDNEECAVAGGPETRYVPTTEDSGSMRLIVIGTALQRGDLREQLEARRRTSSAEFDSLAEARASGLRPMPAGRAARRAGRWRTTARWSKR